MPSQKYYKCKGCGGVATILTLGDLYHGHAGCGSQKGYLVKEGMKGQWQEYQGRNTGTDLLHKLLS